MKGRLERGEEVLVKGEKRRENEEIEGVQRGRYRKDKERICR